MTPVMPLEEEIKLFREMQFFKRMTFFLAAGNVLLLLVIAAIEFFRQ